jgi:hypothetical protein
VAAGEPPRQDTGCDFSKAAKITPGIFLKGIGVTQVFRTALAACVLAAGASLAEAQQAPNQPAPPAPASATPAAQVPPAPAAAVPAQTTVAGTVSCPAPTPPAVAPSRAFNAPAGMLLYQVIPVRVLDFERLIAYVRDSVAKTTNAKLREQFKGLTIWRTVEAGPNGDALYVFLVNPAVPCADYSLGQLLAEAYPDPAQLGEIWKLYTSSVRATGTTLLNLVPVPVTPATPPLTPPTTPPGAPATGVVPPSTTKP